MWSLKMEKEAEEKIGEICCEKNTYAQLVLKTEEGAMSPGVQAASRTWTGQGHHSPWRLQEDTACPQLDVDLVRPKLDFWKMISVCCFKPPSLQ